MFKSVICRCVILLENFTVDDNSVTILTEGEHTRTKTMVASKIGGLAAFTKKRETCIGCKTPLDIQGMCIGLFLCIVFLMLL